MADPKQVPEELKEIVPYIQRAQEVAKVDPVVSYFCKYYAVRRAISSGGKTSKESQEYLALLMDELEYEKGQLSWHGSMKDDPTASKHCIVFGLKIFAKADTEDRSMRAGKVTARNFIVASQFLQIIASFGELPEDIAEKIKYAKWRAAEILKAIREGRAPAPVPDNGGQNGVDQMNVAGDVPPVSNNSSPAQFLGNNANDILGWPSPPNVSSPGSSSAAAAGPATTTVSGGTPAAAAAAPAGQWTGGAGGTGNYPSVSSTSPPPTGLYSQQPYVQPPQMQQSPPPQPSIQPPQMQMNTPQFDSLPSVPHSSVHSSRISPSQQNHQTNVPPSIDEQREIAGPSQYHSSAAAAAASSSSSSSSDAPPSAAAFIPVPASSLPAQMNSQDEICLDPTVAKNAQKHARWAISALEYDDVATSIENLQKAIQILAPYRK
ncbi:hypothetical protein LPJ74_005624 [Coemansia sp. RSA 1843]|nr:hypothetical protein LPJ74_005624 [Coemansia sp. RSA 1843]